MSLLEDQRQRMDRARGALRGHDASEGEGASPAELAEAFRTLGNAADPAPYDVLDYDHTRFGPLLGVSDEGSAVETLAEAARRSPKAIATGSTDPLTIGLAIDAERMTQAGEVPVGPEEWETIVLGARGRLLLTTNVGVRSNPRSYQRHPVIFVGRGHPDRALGRIEEQAKDVLAPFREAGRALTVFLSFAAATPRAARKRVLSGAREAFARGTFCDPERHRVGLRCRVGRGGRGKREALGAIELARDCGVEWVSLDGELRHEVAPALSLPGLLGFFDEAEADAIVRAAAKKPRVRVTPTDRVDVATTARNAWSNLHTARAMGAHLGKYGLLPLTLEEQRDVVTRVQAWWQGWAPVPAFYVDQPLVTEGRVWRPDEARKSAGLWLEMVAGAGARAVLFDSPGRIDLSGPGDRHNPNVHPRRLLKRSPKDGDGVLRLADLEELDRRGRALGLRLLWAGGISTLQVYELGRLGVFGIYTTGTTTKPAPLSPSIAEDPLSASGSEPVVERILEVKMLLEAGFLASASTGSRSGKIAAAARRLLHALAKADEADRSEAAAQLGAKLVEEWKRHLDRNGG